MTVRGRGGRATQRATRGTHETAARAPRGCARRRAAPARSSSLHITSTDVSKAANAVTDASHLSHQISATAHDNSCCLSRLRTQDAMVDASNVSIRYKSAAEFQAVRTPTQFDEDLQAPHHGSARNRTNEGEATLLEGVGHGRHALDLVRARALCITELRLAVDELS